MTLSVRGARKIYTSTDKIFELSEKDPIALMIYNNLEFMGTPLDVAIKHFRGSSDCCQFSSLEDAAEAFFAYLSVHWKPSDEVQNKHVRQLVWPVFREIRRKFNRAITKMATQNGDVGNRVHQIFIDTVSDRINYYSGFSPADCFLDTPEDDLLEAYKTVFQESAKSAFDPLPLSEDDNVLIFKLGSLILHREIFSDMLSGLVFSGFGNDEMFPSLHAYHIDGIIAGKLKKAKTDEEKTGNDAVYSKIIPFAQREVVDRFLVGIDPDLEVGVENYFKSALAAAKTNLFEGMPGMRRATKVKILANLEKTMGVAVSEFNQKWLNQTKERYQQQTEDMVLFMAKQELAQLAEALVNITSLKRKFSAEEETVAGPIDVAVISKSDGFVWVKRKHYFPPELNTRYFVRKFGVSGPGLGPRPGGNHAAAQD